MKKPDLALLEAGLVALVMAAFLFWDPFGINYHIIDFLRLKFFIFTKEPRLLAYTYMYMGSLIAKAAAIILIFMILASRREGIGRSLAINRPVSASYRRYILPFVMVAAVLRVYYAKDPLLPNLPIRFVFSDAMIAGNAVIISSVLFIAPLAEEVIFRGYMYGALEKPFGAYRAIFAVSFLFAMAHMPQLGCEFFPTLTIFILGLFFGVLRYRTGSLLVPILFHAIYNAVYIVVGAIAYFVVGY